MQIRRLTGGRLTGIKANLKASPERISYSDRDGTRHTSVAYILSLEIGGRDLLTLVTDMTEPVRLLGEGRAAFDPSRGVLYVARERDAERAAEIAGEFYPDNEAAADESADRSTDQSDRDEQLGRICELARQLRYKDVKTKMLIGQSAGDLAELERKLLIELEDQSGKMPAGNGDSSLRGQPKEVTPESSGSKTATSPVAVGRDGSAPLAEGFLF